MTDPNPHPNLPSSTPDRPVAPDFNIFPERGPERDPNRAVPWPPPPVPPMGRDTPDKGSLRSRLWATIIAVDIDPRKLEWAKDFGATHTVNSREVDAVAKIKELTGGNGVNFSFEAVGRAETLEQAIFCRDNAGTCIFIGVPGPGKNLTLDLQRFFDLGGYLGVSWYGNCLPTRDFPMLAEWYRQGQLNLDKIVTRTIKLEEAEDAFDAMERGETLRSVIVFE